MLVIHVTNIFVQVNDTLIHETHWHANGIGYYIQHV